jgi:hypothetical protein
MKRIYLVTTITLLITFVFTAQAQLYIYPVAGTGVAGDDAGGAIPTGARLRQPYAVAMAAASTNNAVFIVDFANSKIKEIITGGLYTVAGGVSAGFGGNRVNATDPTCALNLPAGIWSEFTGDTLVFADYQNNAIRSIVNSHAGYFIIINMVDTNASQGSGGDGGSGQAAQLHNPTSVFRDASKNLYIADGGNNEIRKVTNGGWGTISTICGNGTAGSTGDGSAATGALLNNPSGVFVDSTGNIYIADYGNHKVRMIDAASGNISTIAGNGTAGNSGDGGAATSAMLNGPTGLYVYAGNLYIADRDANVIRMVNLSSGNISTVAGTGTAGYNGDNIAATTAQLKGPTGVFVDVNTGEIYIADAGNNRVRKLAAPNAVHNVNPLANTQIYPSPTTGRFVINLPDNLANAQVEVTDMIGAIVFKTQMKKNSTQIDMSAYPDGMYSVDISSGISRIVKKLVINH